ncbi:hypothetical protein [Mucilaginibacter sp.]|uniref:Rab family GTPase n=1 Tax=Mucilaginibacter sp. TaxID=1882438 RepID=UPI002624945B|nr:hypothetical protein [Mucilaginibacter sp.]MDB4922918.1 Ras family [Mucilaginibacter sp.]
MESAKILVIGEKGVGKTEFTKSISWYPPTNIFKKFGGVGYLKIINGRCKVKNSMIYIYCLDEPNDEALLRNILEGQRSKFDAILFMFDASKVGAKEYLDELKQHSLVIDELCFGRVPYLMVANKIDLLTKPNLIRNLKFGLSSGQQIEPCNAMNKDNVAGVFYNLLQIINNNTHE